MSDPALELVGVTKRYRKITERSLLKTLWPFGRPPVSEVTALDQVDLTVRQGEAVGIIGSNGAGKSTLLRLLAGVTQPSAGTVTIRGRVAPLLSVGVGFHQEMTGRENIFINGMLLGLSRDEVAQRFESIVGFADIPGFLDTPVKFYSSGMFMRLGFAVAVHADPDILIIDEVLAVGDNAFQLRSLNRIRELASGGTTIVFVSHSMHAVHLLCPRSVFVHHGRVLYDGPTEEAIARYHATLAARDQSRTAAVEFLHAALRRRDGRDAGSIRQTDELELEVGVRFNRPVDDPGFWFHVIAGDGRPAYSMQTPVGDPWRSFASGEEATLHVRFTPRLAGGGSFHVNVDLTEFDGTIMASALNVVTFYVPPVLGASGPADLMASIVVDGAERTQKWTRLGGAPLPAAGASPEAAETPG